jgi:ferrous iron transport protein A
MILKLSELRSGQRAIIKSYTDNSTFLKLMEMGCVPGESILLEKKAPFGDPISVKIAGYTLSLRLSEAQNIVVETIDNQHI